MLRCAQNVGFMTLDLNASLNLVLRIVELPPKIHLKHPSRTGFYWKVSGQEPIVPAVR